MRSKNLLLLVLPLASCADTGYTATRLKNPTSAPQTVVLVGTSGNPAVLKRLQADYRADTAFFTQQGRTLTLRRQLAAGDSLDIGREEKGPLFQPNPPPLDWDTLIIRRATGQSVRLTATSVARFVTGTLLESYVCCGEYKRITKVYEVAVP